MKTKGLIPAVLIIAGLFALRSGPVAADGDEAELLAPGAEERTAAPGEPMTVARLEEIIRRVDNDAEREAGVWSFTVKGHPITVISDEANDRMRIVTPVARAEALGTEMILRIMQANFDSALDARYAIAHDLLWSTFIHPLEALGVEEFLSGLGQTVNLATTFGSTFSSGLLVFGGGDSQGILERELIDELIRRGKAT